jgi:hypothetical protein
MLAAICSYVLVTFLLFRANVRIKLAAVAWQSYLDVEIWT